MTLDEMQACCKMQDPQNIAILEISINLNHLFPSVSKKSHLKLRSFSPILNGHNFGTDCPIFKNDPSF